ncbi:MAG: hypothetical protein MJZ20_00675 [Bacteroidaceae bacterium]|nr:hypothetical protein [Bacteroidaceae bacterium]
MKIKFISAVLVISTIFVTTSCVNDDTTNADRELSEITIDSTSVNKVYNINKNDILTIHPKVHQSLDGLELTYTWEINQDVYSHANTFEYNAKLLGTFQCRLIVENSDGKTFYPFTINVNSPYEEGIAVISQDTEGKSMLSFMLTPTDPETPRHFTSGDCFAINNQDTPFASRAIDMVQSSGSLIIACQGVEGWQDKGLSGHNADVPTLYYLNEKTLVAENILTVAEYSDFKPTHLIIPSVGASGVAYPVLCENGSIYEFSTTEGAISKPTKLQSKYAQTCLAHDDGGTGWYFDLIFWDKTVGGLCEIYSGYGPYYCGHKYHLLREECQGQDNYFNGNDIVKIVLIELTDKQKRTERSEILVLTKNAFMTRKTILDTGFWVYDASTGSNVLFDNGGTTTACVGTDIINENTPCVANKTYYSLLFGKGNRLMRWNYTTQQTLDKADVLQTFGSDDAIITDLVLSSDHLTMYVAFYEPNQPGLNGSVYVINTDNGKILERHDNVCYRPTRMIYKKK